MDLESKLNNCPKKYGIFEKTFENVLNAHAPKKAKFLRGNQKPHFDKNLRKAMMKPSQLKKKANRTKTLEDITKYKKERNLVVKLNRGSKTKYFDNIQASKNSKPFWDKFKLRFQINMLTVTLKSFLLRKKMRLNKRTIIIFQKLWKS